jgi:hypothetical protein
MQQEILVFVFGVPLADEAALNAAEGQHIQFDVTAGSHDIFFVGSLLADEAAENEMQQYERHGNPN